MSTSWQVSRLHACKLTILAAQLYLAANDHANVTLQTVAAFNFITPLLEQRPLNAYVAQALLISGYILEILYFVMFCFVCNEVIIIWLLLIVSIVP